LVNTTLLFCLLTDRPGLVNTTLTFCLLTDRPGLVNTQAVGKLRDKLCEALQLQLSRNHPTDPHLFQAIWAHLPELRVSRHKSCVLCRHYRQFQYSFFFRIFLTF